MINGISNLKQNKFMKPRPDGAEIKNIVITYTVIDSMHKTVTHMFNHGTSVHYTIGEDGFQNQFHDENQSAFYAGRSSWLNQTSLNANSIGIMLLNNAESEFPEMQITQLIDLIHDINDRHSAELNVVGLGEITVGRDKNAHIAPGGQFPWHELAKNGIGQQVSVPDGISTECHININDTSDAVKDFQGKLIEHGYGIEATGIFDEKTEHCLKVFTDRYIPGHKYCWSDTMEYVIGALLGEVNKEEGQTEVVHDDL